MSTTKMARKKFDALLARHVDADGWVDYDGLQTDAA